MLTTLKIENFRRFKSYEVSGLKRVNLLVGKNNSGKSSLLEAVEVLASGGDPLSFARVASSRGEVTKVRRNGAVTDNALYPSLAHMFYGHLPHQATPLRLQGDPPFGDLNIEIYDSADPDIAPEVRRVLTIVGSERCLLCTTAGRELEPQSLAFAVNDDFAWCAGSVITGDFSLRGKTNSYRRGGGKNVEVVPLSAGKLDASMLATLWDAAILSGREPDALAAMRVLEPLLVSLHFLTGGQNNAGGRSECVVGLQGLSQRIPLGSLGEGATRLLALSLCLIKARAGILLVDEIETGLHYSVMGDLWHLIVEAAMQSNVQVFATTHSFDCLRGLAWLCENYPELGEEVSLQKIEPSLDKAVPFDAKNIIVAVKGGIEVR